MSFTPLRSLQRLRAAQCLPKLSAQQLRTYLILRTIVNPSNPNDFTLPSDVTLPSPPKTTILLTTPSSASSLTPSSLSALTNSGTTSVLAAVIDSLPTPGPHHTCGHSYLITDHPLRIKLPPPVSTSSSPDTPLAAGPTNNLTLTLPNNAHVTLPLAPTLFQTGTPTTFVHLPSSTIPLDLQAAPDVAPEEVLSFAEAREDIREAFHELQDLISGLAAPVEARPPKDSVVVEFPPEAILGEEVRLRSEMPLRMLTEPRMVGEAFGNILKSVEVGEESFPASWELEKMVTGECKGVWARITRTQPGEVEKEMVMKPGVRLHRVLSGGGGWGAKKGLLSLDPQLEKEGDGKEVERFAEMFEKRFEGREEMDGGDEALVQSGEWVQFFEVMEQEGGKIGEEGELRLAFGGVEKEGDRRKVVEGQGVEKVIDGLWGGRAERWVDFVVGGKRKRVDVPGGTIVVSVKEVEAATEAENVKASE